MIPTYELDGNSWELKGRGTVYTATLTCECNHNDVCELIGTEVTVNGKKKKILGVEQFSVFNQSFKPFGILVEKEDV